MSFPGAAWMSTFVRHTVSTILSIAPVPQHIAFIMDGNRRYAERQHLQTVQGHTFGYQRLIQALEWCLDLGVQCVTVYAFSIDNYKRSEEEVATLMHLAEEKLISMMHEHAILERHGVQVRIIGDLSLAPTGVRKAAETVMAATRHHDRAILNICFSYTSSREMQQAMDATTTSPSLSSIDNHLYTVGCPPVDLLVRTSGERRLSDFLLRQSSHALLVFTEVLWPDFGFFDLVSAIVKYQKSYNALQAAEQAAATAIASKQNSKIRLISNHHELIRLKLKELEDVDKTHKDASVSPCGVATPGGSSSPSSRSEASINEVEEELLLDNRIIEKTTSESFARVVGRKIRSRNIVAALQ